MKGIFAQDLLLLPAQFLLGGTLNRSELGSYDFSSGVCGSAVDELGS
jgi:hypothetical protein